MTGRWRFAWAWLVGTVLASGAFAQAGQGPISGGGGGGGLPGAGEVTEAMLKAIDAAGDEECFTYEADAPGDFEWQPCGTALADADYGDVVVSSSGTVLTVEDLTCTNCIGSTEINGATLESEIEAVADLQDFQGAVTDAQVPDGVTVTLAATATALAANGGNCTVGNYPLGVDASGAVESCTALPSAAGDVVGPASSVDNAIARYDSTTGKLLQGSGLILGDVVSGTGGTLSMDTTSGTEQLTIQDDGGSTNFNVGFIPRGASGQVAVAGNGVNNGTAIILGGVVKVVAAGSFQWSSTSNTNNASDAGFARNAAGVIRSTNGSTGISGFMGGGAAVASATAMPVPTGRVLHVTGTTTITSITSTNFVSGAVVTLIFDDVLTFTDGNNLKLAGDFVTSADDTITIAYDGSNWYETDRSVN